MDQPVLTGSIQITDNLNFINTIIESNDPHTVIINLDEFNHFKSHMVIEGAILLPPPEASMAEADGDEQAYDYIFNRYYDTQDVQLIVTGIINWLYRGGTVFMYYPTLDAKESPTVPKLMDNFYNKFGIGIGILGYSRYGYNPNYTPLWLSMLYRVHAIGPMEYIGRFPINVQFESYDLDLLLEDLRLPDETIQDQINHINHLKIIMKEKPNLKEPFYRG